MGKFNLKFGTFDADGESGCDLQWGFDGQIYLGISYHHQTPLIICYQIQQIPFIRALAESEQHRIFNAHSALLDELLNS